MSDLQRISSPLGSSPSRNTSISRPAWPWSSSSNLRYSHRSSTSSIGSTSGSVTSPAPAWDRGTASPASFAVGSMLKQNMGTSTVSYGGNDDTTRQWTFMGFEWTVRNVAKLRDYVEGIGNEATEGSEDSSNADVDFEVLKLSPIMGDNKFKLEIAPTPLNDVDANAKTPGLSLYVTSLILDYAHAEYEINASMMAAIKCQDNRLGERGARPDWVWEHWQNDWAFRQESEVWACSLPSLSSLLENSRIRETDSFVICVQIHCPIGPYFPSQPAAYFVPRDLLDGLEASLDNPNTGDIRFVCLERLRAADTPSSPLLSTEVTSPVTHRPPSSASSYSPFAAEMTARKRIIYAHSDILTRRSDYFATMLASSFSENQAIMHGERKVYTVVVEEADFETIYWLLKYCYANWLLFKEVDDPRLAVEGIGAGWSAHWLNSQGGEWDWKTFTKSGLEDSPPGDTRSAASGESILSQGERSKSPVNQSGQRVVSNSTSVRPNASNATCPPRAFNTSRTSGSSATTSQRNMTSTTSTPRRPAQSASGSTIPVNTPGSSSAAARTKPLPLTVPSSTFSSPSHYPVSPRASTRPRRSSNALDPHVHPTAPPPPASALSMYQIAHRYAMPALQTLALEHMMSTITPQSSFALLLATSAWEELHGMVEDYVVEKWEEVSVSPEFEQCCQEVAGGEWGAEGGKTMMTLFRRLRSPGTLLYTRT